MGFKMITNSELICEASGSGILFAKKGSMIADQGNFKYSKRLLGTNSGGLMGQIGNHLARRITGENLEIMEIKGNGTVYLADNGTHVTIIELEPNGPWQSIYLESENILAFTETCTYSVDFIPAGAATKDLFKSKLTYNGNNALIAVKTNGNPILLEAPCRVDPDALVAWTGEKPSITADVGWKTLLGQSSGESYMFEFKQHGQLVLVQPQENISQVGISIDGNGGRNTYNSYGRR